MRTGFGFLRDGEQFELELFPGVPWNGCDPRGLTKVGLGLFLRQEPPGHEVDFRDPDQLELWPPQVATRNKSGRRKAPAAPSLLSLGIGRMPRRSFPRGG